MLFAVFIPAMLSQSETAPIDFYCS